jgi:glucose/arabinose dehydrogenase
VPWGLAFLPDGDVLVTERPGRVRLISGGQLVAEPVATIPVAATGEGGLLGIAADPGFAENRRFYLYFTTDKDGRRVNRVVRYVLAADRRSAMEDRVLLDDIPGASFHDGGRIRFGPDGMLYVGTGDAGVPSSAQDPGGVSGKILRITTEGAPAPGNPFGDGPAYVLGLRNTQAFGWLDDATLAVGDHGPSGDLGRFGHDEVTIARKGANLGWPDVYACEAKQGMETPVLVFAESTPPGGGSVYRGSAIPEWQGSFMIGTLRSRHLHRVLVGADGGLQLHEVYLAGDPPAGLGRVREALEGPDGALWVTTSNCDGRGTCPVEKDVVVRIVGGG